MEPAGIMKRRQRGAEAGAETHCYTNQATVSRFSSMSSTVAEAGVISGSLQTNLRDDLPDITNWKIGAADCETTFPTRIAQTPGPGAAEYQTGKFRSANAFFNVRLRRGWRPL